MDVDEFWALVEASGRAGTGRAEREAFLSERLLPMPREDLLDFEQHLVATREPANTWRLWGAAELIYGQGCSGDSFHYFQMWLVGLGRKVYEAATDDPDSLADVPEVQRLADPPGWWADDDDWPEWEALEYVAVEAGERRDDIDDDVRDLLTEERGIEVRYDPEPADEEWVLRQGDTERAAQRYPRLWALFGAHWRP